MAEKSEHNLLAEKLGVEPFQVFADKPEEGYFVAFGKMKGKKVLIKIVRDSFKKKVDNFAKEILFDQLAKSHNLKHPSSSFKYIDLIGSGKIDGHHWIIRNFYEGTALAPSKKGYDILATDMIKDKEDTIKKIVLNYNAFREIKFDQSQEEIEEFELGIPPLKDNPEYHAERLKKLSIGDFNPANIILTPEQEVIFTDFEWLCLDNYMMDIAYLWVFFWRDKILQDYWYKAFVQNEADQENFRLSVQRLLETFDWKDEKILNDERFLERNKKWHAYYENSKKSIEELIST